MEKKYLLIEFFQATDDSSQLLLCVKVYTFPIPVKIHALQRGNTYSGIVGHVFAAKRRHSSRVMAYTSILVLTNIYLVVNLDLNCSINMLCITKHIQA